MTDIPQTPEAPESPPAEPAAEERLGALERDLADARREGLNHLRRALLAEHAGTLVPELVAGDSADALEASVDVATAAFEAARQAVLAELRREQAAQPGSADPTPTAAATPKPTGATPATSVAPTPASPGPGASLPAAPPVPAATPARDLAQPEPRSPFQRIAAGLARQY